MGIQSDYDSLVKHASKMRQHASFMEKQAFDPLSFLGSWAIGDTAFRALKRFGRKQAPALLQSGIELGQKGEKVTPYVDDLGRNILGNSGFSPHGVGLQIGNEMRAKNMSPAESDQHLMGLAAQAAKRRHQAVSTDGWDFSDAFNPEVLGELHHHNQLMYDKETTDPVTDALAGVANGEGDNWVKRALVRSGVPQNAKRHLGHEVAQATYSIPGAVYLDSRLAARPLVRRAEQSPVLNKVTENVQNKVRRLPGPLPQLTTSTAQGIRKYID